jgi:predicted  nucleic acid-binding Zn-ribbon protein
MATNYYAKLVDGQPVTTCIPDDDPDTLAMILADGFKPYDDSAEPPVVGEFQAAVAVYREEGDRILLRWETAEHSPEKIAAEIARLQSELAATDYRVVKSYEFTLAGEKPPYDPAALHSERQALRNQITELEDLFRE